MCMKAMSIEMFLQQLHGPSMFALKAKIYGVLYKQSSSIAFDKASSYWSALKSPYFFSAFHWSPHGSLVSIGQNFVTNRVVHLPKRTETSLITESDQSGPNHQLLQLCTARTAWSDSDQAVRAVHSCISWFYLEFEISVEEKFKKAIDIFSVTLAWKKALSETYLTALKLLYTDRYTGKHETIKRGGGA